MAKIETEVSVRIGVDNSEANKKIEELKEKLRLASENLNKLKTQFGENSQEVKNAEQEVIALTETISKIKAVDINVNDEGLKTAKNEIDSLGDKEVNIDANTENAKKSVEQLKLFTNEISDKELNIGANTDEAEGKISEIKDNINSVSSKSIEIKADNSDAIKEIDEVKTDVAEIPESKDVKLTASNEASKSIGDLKNQLNDATANVEKLTLKFGENSDEVKQAKAEVAKLNEQLNNTKADESKFEGVKSLKVQLREANNEFLKLAAEFGEFSKPAQEAAKKVAELKDQIGDAKSLTDAFNPDAKFKAFSGAIQSVVGGFAALQGAQALFGSESKELQQTLVKVQGALALSQGINSILEAKDSFKILKVVAIDAFNGIKTAIGSTGIGLLVVALGAIYAYWDDIKEAVSGVSEEAVRQNKLLKDNVETEQKKLDSLNEQDNILKLQGKSEKEILQSKLNQYDVIIKATEAQIEGEAEVQKQKETNAKRNFEITKNILRGGLEIGTFVLRLLAAPIDALIGVANKVSKLLGGGELVSENLNEKISKLNDSVASYASSVLFDPDKVAKEGKKANEEALKNLNKLKNDRAGLQLQINKIDEDAANKAKELADKNAKERADAEKSANEELKKLRDENSVNELKSERDKAYKKLELDNKTEGERINSLKISNELKNKLLAENAEKYQIEKRKLDEQYAKEDEKKAEEYANRVNEIETQIRIAGITNQFDKQIEELKVGYDKQYKEIEKNETYTAEQKLELKKQLQEKENAEISAIEKNRTADLFNRQVTELDAIINDSNVKIQAKKDAIDKEARLNQLAFENKKISEEEYNKNVKKLSEDRTKIAEEEGKTRVEIAQAIGDSLGKLSELVGKQTAVGKGLAVAQATINTFLGATEVIKQKSVLPEPVATISKVVNVATIIASGIKAVKEILKVKVEGASGGSTPSPASVSAPITPQAQQTTLNQDQINQLSSATTRAFVVESDVSGNQERIRRLNRASRIN